MSPLLIALLILAITIPMDVLIFWALIRSGWSSLGNTFGPADVAPDAVCRRFQSIAFDYFNFGLCVHIAVDDRYLHLIPSGLVRWAGPRPISIPWESLKLVKHRRRFAVAKVGKVKLTAPKWALELAALPEPAAAG